MKVAIMCNNNSSQGTSRSELITCLRQRGAEVYVGAVNDGIVNENIANVGAEFLPIVASRTNTNPFVELHSLFSIKKTLKLNKIDAVIIYGIKNHSAMAIAAKLAGINDIICIVNGRGNLLSVKGVKGIILRAMAIPMLIISYYVSKKVCFQNSDDMAYFIKRRLVNAKKAFLTGGSGVNIVKFPEIEMPEDNKFLFLARITPTKGMVEFIAAAEKVKEKYPEATFDIVGPLDNAVEGSCKETLDKAIADKVVSYHGLTTDVSGWMGKSRFFVYPSYYPEGVPRCVLQALSTGRPIITCTTPGCKDTVENGINGILVPPKDVEELAKKMIWMIEHTADAKKMGQESRRLAETKYNVDVVNETVVNALLNSE